ncbi:MAG: metal-dependent transcriptional regulator [Candidatus Bathyarchaeota archaeon]|nr:metal-dependent transcriptional regulator [Candidatus Bathyarchaeota archaeon]MDH5688266.1 metal-dependent transcriptional regulator [Candidatus Bathyarchaeota archaeon]
MATTVSSVIEEYLEVIYRLQERSGVARTLELAEMLNVAPGTITNTVERLEKESLIVHEPYKGVRLTEKGRGIALRMVRKHRLSERLLTDILDVEWDKVHDAACQLEHGISDEIAKRIEKALGHPKTCPHGNPVPTECGGIIEESSLPLARLSLGEKGVIVKIADESPELLQYLETLGLKPDTFLEVVQKAPFDGPITVRVDGKDHAISRAIARLIGVREIDK